jgi:Flp pilus assembly protein TadG
MIRERRGNVAIIFGLTMPVLIFAIGMAVDFSLASRSHEKLNAIADAAALAAVTSTEMEETDAQAKQAALDMFNGQVSQSPNVALNANQPKVSITHPNGPLFRTATVTYSAKALTFFSGVLGAASIPLHGTSVATSAVSPNINFYVLLDNSSSMALPATEAGIVQMQALTPQQNSNQGCAFACHEVDPNSVLAGETPQIVGNPCANGTTKPGCQMIDNYQLARNNNITLRIDEVNSAIGSLISTATTYQNGLPKPPTYNFSVYSIDSEYNVSLTNVMPMTSSYASAWASDSASFTIHEAFGQDQACVAVGSNPCGAGAPTVSGGSYVDVGFLDTKLSPSLAQLAATIPVAGTGATGSTPKEILFFVTDGLEDTISNGGVAINVLSATGQAACTTLKNNGVKVAVLYTTYFPTPNFWLYQDYVTGIQSSIGPALQSCASPNLYEAASPGEDVSSALNQLFLFAIESAHLTQ